MDEITITAGIIVPLQNPDVPQGRFGFCWWVYVCQCMSLSVQVQVCICATPRLGRTAFACCIPLFPYSEILPTCRGYAPHQVFSSYGTYICKCTGDFSQGGLGIADMSGWRADISLLPLLRRFTRVFPDGVVARMTATPYLSQSVASLFICVCVCIRVSLSLSLDVKAVHAAIRIWRAS